MSELEFTKTVFICADHGLALIYFLQSDVVPTLLAQGIRVVMLTEDALVEPIRARFGKPNLLVEGLREDKTKAYFNAHKHNTQYWLHFLRWMGGSDRVNTHAMDGHMRQMQHETSRRGKLLMPAIRGYTALLRKSKAARQALVKRQAKFWAPIYAGLFDKYQPDMVIASTPGWRMDRYLLREAYHRGVPRTYCVIGWDNPSSYRLPGVPMDYATCWSEIQKQELVLGSDWPAERVNIGGIPTYDGYFRHEWQMPRDEYFKLHNLDPNRKLLAYACSFVTFAPNYPNIEALAELVINDELAEPCQLLIRLHPNHFMTGSLYEQEAKRVRALVDRYPHVHLVEPVALGAGLSHYSGEDMVEKSSMMGNADIFLTVYSTMVVETAIHNRPIVSVCIDVPGGWNKPEKFSLALAEIAEWPTHERFREANAGKVAFNKEEIKIAVNAYLRNPHEDEAARNAFIEREVTFTDGSAGRRTGEHLAKLILNTKGRSA
ncbi:MAG TPA: hypothetical protein PKD55_10445 [Bellilinea sp.]|nr:hypothetical protein [Bellilinea sp.]